jgi:peptidoglycan/LPS O-acetylase OafA/YrhL
MRKLNNASRLPALTGLRFFAAAAILVHHLRGYFGISSESMPGWHLDQGVSVFFVLSGFILYHVYPRLPTWEAKGHFLLARVARIWPAHLTALIIGFALLGRFVAPLPSSDGYMNLLTNVLLVHAWIPKGQYYFSYNSVSWSISTEFGFYLMFPFFVVAFRRSWWWKLALAFGLAVAMILVSNAFSLPGFDPAYRGVTSHGLVYVNPLARLFEFVLGMCSALAWQRLHHQLQFGRTIATAIELAAVALLLANISIGLALAFPLWSAAGAAGHTWLASAGFSALPAALLIFVLATGRGWIGALLSTRPVMLLGEVSFSIYLTHQLLLRYYQLHRAPLDAWLGPLALPGYLLAVLVLSYAIWRLIERPARSYLVGWWPATTRAPDEAGARPAAYAGPGSTRGA